MGIILKDPVIIRSINFYAPQSEETSRTSHEGRTRRRSAGLFEPRIPASSSQLAHGYSRCVIDVGFQPPQGKHFARGPGSLRVVGYEYFVSMVSVDIFRIFGMWYIFYARLNIVSDDPRG